MMRKAWLRAWIYKRDMCDLMGTCRAGCLHPTGNSGTLNLGSAGSSLSSNALKLFSSMVLKGHCLQTRKPRHRKAVT